jgi:HAD superfamily hydrolase (TIGR01509 family)
MSRFDCVLFDCDGVLVDSEPITLGVLTDLLTELGAVVTIDEVTRLYVGKSVKEDRTITPGLIGRALPADFYETFIARRDAALADRIEPVRHVRAAIEALTRPYAVVTGADTGKMRLTLSRTGLLPLFEGRMFSGSMVERSKPAPDVYLLAARTLAVDPARCVVIEDTPTGVTAGVASGATVFGYCERQDAKALRAAGAVQVFDDMRMLAALLA